MHDRTIRGFACGSALGVWGRGDAWFSGRNGADGDRTHNLYVANVALSQLSYGPVLGAVIVLFRGGGVKWWARVDEIWRVVSFFLDGVWGAAVGLWLIAALTRVPNRGLMLRMRQCVGTTQRDHSILPVVCVTRSTRTNSGCRV